MPRIAINYFNTKDYGHKWHSVRDKRVGEIRKVIELCAPTWYGYGDFIDRVSYYSVTKNHTVVGSLAGGGDNDGAVIYRFTSELASIAPLARGSMQRTTFLACVGVLQADDGTSRPHFVTLRDNSGPSKRTRHALAPDHKGVAWFV